MIYKKPQDALHMLDLVVDGGGVMSWVREVRLFLSTLPAEFEIVEPGMTQVKWPDGWTREYLLRSSRGEYGDGVSLRALLEALADIAPEEKKKRKVWLWEKDHPHYTERSWTSNDIDRSGGGWRKVGECEVDA